ncbi:gamma-glutamyltransferase [Pelagibaculum spongiae]|uniref:Glutathione hydrolase proenzyme n=1 Tax=Pelagibaculum spongiae TaxID=2080658 RepID=A0A2V1GXS1_9GAMM|nr:gamma-glutamyltransferase [Pelagibaculum spongiae]PVZ66312.1 gamma-glutamyltransferase [Pelagibaculum spongiae]
MKKMIFPSLLAALLLIGNSAAIAQEARDPEAATGTAQTGQQIIGNKQMVATANPYASKAGFEILQAGGSAIDAAIAVQMVLTMVEPQSSGIGGGSFMLHWQQDGQQLTTWDGRETAPMAATSELFIKPNGDPMSWWLALAGGRSVGVPGVLRMLEQAHKKHGKLPWERLFQPAIRVAENGFIVSDRLNQLLVKRFNPAMGRYDAAWDYFFPNGQAITPGTVLKNPPLANTFKRIALLGADAFYRGDIAVDIVKTVHDAKDNPGVLTESDLANYQAKERPAVCGYYRSYKVCGMGMPSSGGATVLQTLKLLERFPLDKTQPLDPQAVHLISQASKLAFADRNRYMADSDFVSVPVEGLLDDDYINHRSRLIQTTQDMGKAKAGRPAGASMDKMTGKTPSQPSTSHFSIVDADGNSVSMTTSIEMAFGSTLMVRGFLLNNQLTDFSFLAEKNGLRVANRVQPGKRPRSSMSPMMVFDKDGQLMMVIGSPGGSRIIGYVLKTIIGVIDWNLDIQQAINLPHFINRNGGTDLEAGTVAEQLKPTLERLGHKVKIRDLNSGLHGIIIKNNRLHGGADMRREGMVLAE